MLSEICDAVVLQARPGNSDAINNQRIWESAFFVYIMWWEGNSATTRTQMGGGPGRGLMQLEPATVRDLYNHYKNVIKKVDQFKSLCSFSLSIPPSEIGTSFDAFLNSSAVNNRWPGKTTQAADIERWLTSDDSIGVALMHLQLTRGTTLKIPPRKTTQLSLDPRREQFKQDHAELWADYWKKSFTSPQQRKQQISKFILRARSADALLQNAPP